MKKKAKKPVKKKAPGNGHAPGYNAILHRLALIDDTLMTIQNRQAIIVSDLGDLRRALLASPAPAEPSAEETPAEPPAEQG